MPEPKVGQIYKTEDGKTVFVDPKTQHAFVFDKPIVLIDKLAEPGTEFTIPPAALQAFHDALQDFITSPSKTFPAPGGLIMGLADEGEEKDIDISLDILGEKEYYILVPKGMVPLSVGVGRFYMWVSEHKKGHHPEYSGQVKHRICKEQWDWLMDHKECGLLAWYDKECPVFPSIACQDHKKIVCLKSSVDDVKVIGKPEDGVGGIVFTTCTPQIESVWTEEREI
jgi:hypothetical protein